jgi:hypothetical protein
MDERPFNCSNCTKKFSRRHHLERHLKTHTSLNFEINDYLKNFNNVKDVMKKVTFNIVDKQPEKIKEQITDITSNIEKLLKNNLELKLQMDLNELQKVFGPVSQIYKPFIQPITQPIVQPKFEPAQKAYVKPVQKAYAKPVQRTYAKPVQKQYLKPSVKEYIKNLPVKKEIIIKEPDYKKFKTSDGIIQPCFCSGCTMIGKCIYKTEIEYPQCQQYFQPSACHYPRKNQTFTEWLMEDDFPQYKDPEVERECCKNIKDDLEYIYHVQNNH